MKKVDETSSYPARRAPPPETKPVNPSKPKKQDDKAQGKLKAHFAKEDPRDQTNDTEMPVRYGKC